MKKIAVLISNTGTGTNLQALIDGIKFKKINAQIVVVISDIKDAMGLSRAVKNNLKTEIVSKKEELLTVLQKYSPDYICLAGWKQFIVKKVIDKYPNQILNLHPGIIPDTIDSRFNNPDGTPGEWNKKKLTDIAIKNILEKNATYAGSSIHFLTHDFDFGVVLGRCFEKVKTGDTIQSLYQRLKVKENKLYQDVLEKLCHE